MKAKHAGNLMSLVVAIFQLLRGEGGERVADLVIILKDMKTKNALES